MGEEEEEERERSKGEKACRVWGDWENKEIEMEKVCEERREKEGEERGSRVMEDRGEGEGYIYR